MTRLLYLAVALAACGKHAPAPPRPDLDVIAPGAEPRRAVHYALAKGTTTTCELAIDVALDAGQMGGAMPTLVVTLAITADDVLPDGKIKLRTRIVDATSHDRPDSKLPATAI